MNCFPLSKLLEFNDWQNAVTSCPTVPNDLLEREIFYRKHRCSRASTSSKLPEVLMSELLDLCRRSNTVIVEDSHVYAPGRNDDDLVLGILCWAQHKMP